MEQARGFFKKILELIKKPELRILPGQLAFFLVLSFIPLVALVGALSTAFHLPLDAVKITIASTVPKEVTQILSNIVKGQGLNFNITAFFMIAFILASNGPHSIIITSNEAYKIKSDNIIRRRIKSILMTFILVMLFVLLLIIPIWGDTIFKIISIYASNNIPVDFIYRVFKLLQYPIIIIIIYFNIKLIYVIAPDEKITSSSTTKGAAFTTLGWVIASEIYSFYISTFSNYDLFYGSISNVIILLLWIYILSYIFVLGLIINASSYRLSQEKIKELEYKNNE